MNNKASRIINEWYQLYLGRKPNDKEHAQLMQKVRVGTNAIGLQAALISGDEYYKKHGSTTQGSFRARSATWSGARRPPPK